MRPVALLIAAGLAPACTAGLVRAEDHADGGCPGTGAPLQVAFGWEDGGLLSASNTFAGNGVKASLFPDLVPQPFGFEATEGWVRLDTAGPDRVTGAMSWVARDEEGEIAAFAEGGFDVPACEEGG